MKIKLKADFIFSAELKDKKAVEEEIKRINSDVLKKGCPKELIKEAAEITDFKIKKDVLEIEIDSGSRVRAHTALLRIRNELSENLSKKLKVGIRNIEIKDFEIEGIEVESKPKEEMKIPFVKKLEYKDKAINITVDEKIPIDFIEKGAIDRLIELIPEKIKQQNWGGKGEHWELLWTSKKKEPVWDKDPSPEMEKRGWIQKFHRGVWYHTPISTHIMRTFEKIVMDEIIKPLGFQEVILPKTTPLDVWVKTGHIPGSSPDMFYLYQAKSVDPKYWEDFKDYVKITKTVPMELLQSKLEGPVCGMCFSQCPPLYWLFRGKKIPESQLPIKWFDRSGTSHRWEAGGLKGIERDTEFHRIEIVWLGEKEDVIKIKEQIMEKYKKIFEDILDFEWRTAWVTPWYMAQAGQTGKEETKEKGTIDFEAWLPWRGSREKSEWLEFQNLTVAGTKFSDAWNYTTQKNKEVWSGCSGVGLERWYATLTAQKGIDIDKWPEKFRKLLGKVPEEVKLI